MRRAVITGMGAVTPLGVDAETTWRGLIAGRSGVGRLTTFDCTGFPVRIGGQVPDDFDPDSAIRPDADRRWIGRPGRFGLAAVTEALADADCAAAYPPDERGLAMGASVGRPDLPHLLEIARVRSTSGDPTAFVTQPPQRVMADDQNLALNAMARMLGASGPMVGIHTACSGSGHAIGEALRMIQEGDARLMVAGGYDSLTTWADILGFGLLGAMTDRYNDNPRAASRPFDNERSGFVIGEGAVAFVVEERESARARGAHIHAEIRGYGASLNAWRITDSPPDGAGAIEAMEAAIDDSGSDIRDIDVVVAHGTGTQGNDVSETRAIKKVFGDHAYRLAVTSPKSMTGHLTAAAAALNVLVGVGALREYTVPPTINLEIPDRALDLDYVPHCARSMRVSTVLINALAFGGANTSLVIASHREDSP
ncbi:beta-ketoacyl synthase [Nocardia sp. BMG51109]|uniref:beta-ketoacyl-[acyl-carrier-protein] synthase family protein n=1 Tax=Nocardia sp. BMG51109 TaxID=1056816 RepID=UPI0004652C0F|nr:beta-ketoacyl-[acyl-carrier-protein] synthase family protein [Nocardia sp. BMG51109]